MVCLNEDLLYNIGNKIIHFKYELISFQKWVYRNTEAEVAIDSILAHNPIVVRARSTLIGICLTEPSIIASRVDTDSAQGLCGRHFLHRN